MTEPAACSTAWLTKFSEAISSRPAFWRCSSLPMAPAISGSVAASVRQREGGSTATFDLHDLVHAPQVASAFERRRQPEREDLFRQSEADDAAAHGKDVGVVVRAGQARGVEVVAERGADAVHLVRGDLLALAAAADDDAAVGRAGGDPARDVGADRRGGARPARRGG